MAKLEEFKDIISEKVVNLVDRVGTNFPGVSVDNNYIDTFHIFWTNSFFCGILLEVYKNRKLNIDNITLDSYLHRAQEIEKSLDVYFTNLNDFMRLQHDCGFV